MQILTVLVLVLLLAAALWAGWAGRVLVPADHVGIVTRHFGPSYPDPAFKEINPGTAKGVHARTLLPGGIHWRTPVLYSVKYVPRVHVPPGQIGLVRAIEGRNLTDGRTLGRHVDCDNFRDGEAFLLGGGEQGVQVTTLAGGQSYYINTRLFEVSMEPRTEVPLGTVGLVRARAGAVRPPERRFGRHVECNSFQDGQAFLSGGGEQGKQLAVLGGGTSYAINPALFEVITVDNVGSSHEGLTAAHLRDVAISEGYTGVVVTLDGAEPPEDTESGTVAPRVPGHSSFRRPWTFLANGGQRGIQEQTLGQGTAYSLNPWFVRVMLIPTRVLILTWQNKQDAETDNYDADLGPIVVNVQGFDLAVTLSQNLQIPPRVAPRLVSQFGNDSDSDLGGLVNDRAPMKRFVRDVLGLTVAGYFAQIAMTSSVLDFLASYQDVRKELTDRVMHALEKWELGMLGGTLGSFTPTDPVLLERLKAKFYEEMRGENLGVSLKNAKLEDLIDEYRVRQEARRVALELKEEVALLGPDNVAMIRIVREFAKFDVPEYIGGGDITQLAQVLPMATMQDMLSRLRELRTGQGIEATPGREELTENVTDTIDGDEAADDEYDEV
ncbi:SPFH domain-containing protein [Streptomyces sp. GQFP]|uniref:SPFH domain-containing protein n=1 Tax=Streptomyces sp. GQFP TaxID=2907545 RepID=UPI001F1EE5E8|nr:SPFH domain-containing protein [Streptomyces sp. GQFP]UIX35370.1 SPFH domain-containing protein [Streptomyces sp. GQFP]